jgi:site-specific DNA recombinase
MYELGLRNKQGKKVSTNGMSRLLHNPFYTGLIRIETRKELFIGRHQPLISKEIFDRVQLILSGKTADKQHRHFFIFRRLLTCAGCQTKLIGEIQKHHNYYRCQMKHCPQKTIREELVEAVMLEELKKLHFNEIENRYFREQIKKGYNQVTDVRQTTVKALNLQLEQLRSRLSNLADAYIDGMVEKETYLGKKNALVVEENAVKEKLSNVDEAEKTVLNRVERFLELVNNAYLSYKLANQDERRELVKIVTSNLTVEGKNVVIKLNYPFRMVADRQKLIDGRPQRDRDRNLSTLLKQLCVYFKENDLEPDSEEEREKKDYVPLDRLIFIGAKKITT